MDDASLVERVRRGEAAAFEPLLRRHQPSLLRLCRRLMGPTPEAQDVAQEAAVQAYLGLARLRDPGRFGPWLHAIAANLARMALRRRGVLSLDALGEPAAADDAYAAVELRQTLDAALAGLSAAGRAAVVGFYLDGRPYAELAEQLGVPVSAVRGRLFHARRHLRRSLAPLAPSGPSRKERSMPAPAWIETKVSFLSDPLPPGRTGSPAAGGRLVVLAPPGTSWELPIHLSAAEGEALEVALAGEQSAQTFTHDLALGLPAPLTHDLALGLLAPLGARVERVEIQRLVDESFYARVVVARGRRRHAVEARAGDALALAVRAGSPIMVARQVFDARAWNPADRDDLRRRDAQEAERLRRRIAERPAGPPAPPPEGPPLAPDVRRRLEARLSRLEADLRSPLVLVIHRGGGLVAWRGEGDEATLRDYALARTQGDADLIQLLQLAVYPSDRVGGVMFWDVPPDWRLEVAAPFDAVHESVAVLPAERAEDERSQLLGRRLSEAAADLAALLAPTAGEG